MCRRRRLFENQVHEAVKSIRLSSVVFHAAEKGRSQNIHHWKGQRMRNLIVVALVLLSVIGGLVYHYAYKEYEFRFSESQLQEKINAKMPLSKTYLGFLK